MTRKIKNNIMHFKWKYEQPTSEQIKTAEELGAKIGISSILAGILIRRGITTESAAKRFFRPQLNDLINPFLMKDMDVAVDRLNDAMGRKERIMVYGDYDVDGCTAVALVYKFLQQFYSNIDYYIPNRYDEGYGVSHKGIEYAVQTGVKLIIILDCGIKAHDEIRYAKSLGIDFIICDHHVPDETLPPAVATLNPKRSDDTYPFKHLGLRKEQRHTVLTVNSIARPLRRKHRSRHRSRCRRKPHIGLSRYETAQPKPKHRP